jgi:hypothetical protein
MGGFRATRREDRTMTKRTTAKDRGPAPDQEAVARRAYELFEARGRLPGHEKEDWLEAERQLRGQRKPVAARKRPAAKTQ